MAARHSSSGPAVSAHSRCSTSRSNSATSWRSSKVRAPEAWIDQANAETIMRPTTSSLLTVLTIVAMVGAARSVPAQQHPPLVIDSMTGRDLFQFYCATCHGQDARGTGPVAAALKAPPADLATV